MSMDPTRRFSNRVDDYVRYRPHYPGAVLELLRDELGLRLEHVVVDVGSGTGFLTELFLAAGPRVYGVEPNAEMRAAGEAHLANWSGFTSVNGTAEATTLGAQLADFVVAGQAFHWFRPMETRREFRRILRPSGWVVLVWNDRHADEQGLYAAYEKLLHEFRTDDSATDKKNILSDDAPALAAFFAPQPMQCRVVPGVGQDFDFPGLQGRLLSSSYAPAPDHPRHEAMIAALRQLFDQYQQAGRVRFEYNTHIYYGQLEGG